LVESGQRMSREVSCPFLNVKFQSTKSFGLKAMENKELGAAIFLFYYLYFIYIYILLFIY